MRALEKSFNEWRSLSTCNSFEGLSDQAAYWWKQRTLDVAVARWRNYAEFCVILAELMAQADFRYYHKSYSEGFQAWRSYSDMCADSAEK